MLVCYNEGFGLPPLKAAITGGLVVGYRGRGGKRVVRSLILSWRKMVDFVTTSKKFLWQSKTLRVTC